MSSERASAPRSTPEIEVMLRIGRTAYEYGLPGYELSGLLTRVGAALGLPGAVIATPDYIDYTIDDEQRGGQRRMMTQLGDVSYNLGKLSQTLRLADRLEHGGVSVDEANRRLDEIRELRPHYPTIAVGVAYIACGAGFAVILSAAWGDVAFAAALSLVVFGLGLVAQRSEWLAARISVTSAFVAASLASAIAVIVGASNSDVVALCSFVVLVPGLGLTLGVYELTIGHTVLGWNRFISAAVQTFGLFAGASVGTMWVRALLGTADLPDPASPPTVVLWLFLVMLMVGLIIVFQVSPRQAPWAICAGLVAYGGLDLGGRVGDWQGPFLGALALGLFAGLFARIHGHTNPLTVVLPGVLILVPGVAAYASLRAVEATDGIGGVGAFEGVLFQIVALLAGLFVAGSVIAIPRFSARAASSVPTEEST